MYNVHQPQGCLLIVFLGHTKGTNLSSLLHSYFRGYQNIILDTGTELNYQNENIQEGFFCDIKYFIEFSKK